MGNVFLEISMSLDGFVTGKNVGVDNPLGEEGESLHHWMFNGNEQEKQLAGELFAHSGAFILGRRMFDLGIEFWGDDGTFGMPCFVVTTRPQEKLVKQATTFTFVTDGIESAIKQAKAAAGDKNVGINGGADIARQYLKAGLVDELRLHLAPVLLGDGARLFEDVGQPELVQTSVVETPLATHLKYKIVK